MKKFYNLDEAFSYQPNCPLCDEPIQLDYKEMTTEPDSHVVKVVTTFITPGGNEVTIDYYHNNIVSYKEKQSQSSIFNIGKTGQIPQFTGNYNLKKGGIEAFGVNASCTKCSKYGFNLQIWIDWKEWAVTIICLNSESLSFEEGNVLHEIKNIYSTEKTEYDKFTKIEIDDGVVKASGYHSRRNSTVTFPLIPMDLKNPEKFLQRIKTLVIFS
jgi:hypothetical protein